MSPRTAAGGRGSGLRSFNRSIRMKRHAVVLLAGMLAATAQAQEAGTLGKVRKSGEITLGVRESSSPLSYTLGAGEYAGYHVELCNAIVGRLGKTLGRELKIK